MVAVMDFSHIGDVFLNAGLFGVMFIALSEKFTPIFPSYVMFMLLGMAVSDGLTLVMTILATATGSLAGSIIWYGVGRALGGPRVEDAVARFGKYVFFSTQTYQRLANAYRRNHFWVTLIGQTIPVVRIYLALPAGVFCIQPLTFTVAAGIGVLLWNGPFLTLGYLLRTSSQDPFHVGLWVPVALLCMEMAVALGCRLYRTIAWR